MVDIAKSGDDRLVWRYDLEANEFVCRIVPMAQAVHLWDYELAYADLRRDNPHRAYVIAIEYRALRIVDRFKSLNVMDQMMAIDKFPIHTPAGVIDRYQWIRIILDVLLSRMTSIRDCNFLFVAEIYELGLDPREVNLHALKKAIKNPKVVDLLERIAEAARDMRDERDRLLHRGEERALSGEMDQLFKIMAMFEPSPTLGTVTLGEGPTEVTIDLLDMHQDVIDEIRADYYREGDPMIRLTEDLFEAVADEFDRRWAEKRDVAKDVRAWEKGV